MKRCLCLQRPTHDPLPYPNTRRDARFGGIVKLIINDGE